MVCDTRISAKLMQAAIDRLEAALAAGETRAVVGPQGAIAFAGWKDNGGVSDLCAYRRLLAKNSPALRRAIMRAEAVSGRKVSNAAISTGAHSHDGGRTWGTHGH